MTFAESTHAALIPDEYAWLFWSSAFLVPWALIYWKYPGERNVMVLSSLLTMPFGFTEPIFVPEYWDPPSLFDFAQRTGFDIESFIFTFGIGGVGAVLYSAATRQRFERMSICERHAPIHRYHRLALAAPLIVFVALFPLPWNPIYPGIAALLIGGLVTIFCRPDLARKTWRGALLFMGYYALFIFGLNFTNPGYVERVWNLEALTGVVLAGIPLEEMLFAFGFGFYWSGAYEHLAWRRTLPLRDSSHHLHEVNGNSGGAWR